MKKFYKLGTRKDTAAIIQQVNLIPTALTPDRMRSLNDRNLQFALQIAKII